MKSDRELLELAARAAGIINVFACDAGGRELEPWWNPLTDDGDALRLAYTLGLDVDMCACWIQYDFEEDMESLEFEGGSLENVRRAIVRAAAAIGEAMQ